MNAQQVLSVALHDVEQRSIVKRTLTELRLLQQQPRTASELHHLLTKAYGFDDVTLIDVWRDCETLEWIDALEATTANGTEPTYQVVADHWPFAF